MSIPHPTLDSLIRAMALAGLCAFGTAIAATDAPAKAVKPASANAPAKATKPASSTGAKKTAAKPVETGPAEATAEQIDAAERVYYGVYDCEFKQTLDIEKNAKHAAYVDVKTGKSVWVMKPVLSSTGAIRLEDVKGETLMVQISSKSMLLNVKTARRIVDDCISPKQRELIEAEKIAKAAGTSASAVTLGIAAGGAADPASRASTGAVPMAASTSSEPRGTLAANGTAPVGAASAPK